MRRSSALLVAAVVVASLFSIATSFAQETTATVVTVNATTSDGLLKFGEHIILQEFWISDTKLQNGPIGPYPYYFNDLGYGNTSCSFADAGAQAQLAGHDGWIAMAERGKCPGAYQQTVSSAEGAGASGLVFGNDEANKGAPVGPAAEGAQIAGGMVDYADAQRMVTTREGASDPEEVRITLQLLTFVAEENLPPRPKGYRPPPGTGTGFGSFGSRFGDGFGDFGFGDFGDESSDLGDTEVILVPGPDGEMIEMEIPVYAEEAADEAGLNPLIPITISIVLLAAMVGSFFFLRARRSEEDELAY